MKSCDWCSRPETEQAIEPSVVGVGENSKPMMLCVECRGVPLPQEEIDETMRIAQEFLEGEDGKAWESVPAAFRADKNAWEFYFRNPSENLALALDFSEHDLDYVIGRPPDPFNSSFHLMVEHVAGTGKPKTGRERWKEDALKRLREFVTRAVGAHIRGGVELPDETFAPILERL